MHYKDVDLLCKEAAEALDKERYRLPLTTIKNAGLLLFGSLDAAAYPNILTGIFKRDFESNHDSSFCPDRLRAGHLSYYLRMLNGRA